MPQLLALFTSILKKNSESCQLTQHYIQGWMKKNPDGKVVTRDLSGDPIPHLDAHRFGAFIHPAEARTPEQAAVVQESDNLIQELFAADEIIIAIPMYNFMIPSQLKSYLDHIARSGITFKYTEAGSVGLLKEKKAFIVSSRGGVYENKAMDLITLYMTEMLEFLGIKDINFAYAEGLALGEDRHRQGVESAQKTIDEWLA